MARYLFKTAVLLLIILRLAGANACSEADYARYGARDPIAIECWHYYNGAQLATFDRLITTFNQTSGQSAKIQISAASQGNVADLAGKIALAAGSAEDSSLPDIFATYADSAYELARQGLLVDMSQYLSEETLADYRAEFL
ncbi:MAG TPA: ABC transporter substrate-binding protein, partial [Clostridiales bacterium]|nr:ABC transporter substrate-binding protein [Clostridiales bacterium]